jgi:hypothetical protein
MVACGSRIGLRRYCPLLGWHDAHRRRRVAAILVVRGLLLGGGNVDGGDGLKVAIAAHRPPGPHGATEACEKLHCVELLEELLS